MAERDSSRVVVVTGASGGIGRAAARAFGAEGAKVAVLARGETGLTAAAREVRAPTTCSSARCTTGLEWPSDVTAMPAIMSRYSRPSTSHTRLP